ncbi:MAG TPA: hypothetical protein VGT44_13645 [Ktedonobacteraceae bacterium]|nr:hypothetical protein [Ktedonobacteraceae bacterium]
MIEPESYYQLKREIAERIEAERAVLDQLRAEIRPLRSAVRRIQPRTTTSISLVATDGGNNKLQFDPFLVQVVRIVDSSNNEYCLEAVTPSTKIASLSARQFNVEGEPLTALGLLMDYLQVRNLEQLSHMIRHQEDGTPTSPTWVQVYRDLVEWAILFSLVRTGNYSTDTMIIRDGLLRSKIFAGDLFARYLDGLQEGIEQQWRQKRRRIYLTGVAKHSQVLSRYRLAMMLERILTTTYAAYVEIPREIEEKAYLWSEYARGSDREITGREGNKFVGGKMFFVKFGSGPRDPIWPIDIYLPQVDVAQHILGCMLADAQNGFPIPHYPLCLQKAHANAALVDFDFDVLQNNIFDGIRAILGDEAPVLDVFRLQESDPAQRRYE